MRRQRIAGSSPIAFHSKGARRSSLRAGAPAGCRRVRSASLAGRVEVHESVRISTSDRSGRLLTLYRPNPVHGAVERGDHADAGALGTCDEICLGEVEALDLIDLDRAM